MDYREECVSGLPGDAVRKVICYPINSVECINKRIVEASILGLKKFVFKGESELNGVKILGKGTTSIVLLGIYVGGLKVSVKIRRTDANRFSVRKEAEVIEKINRHGIGPRLVTYSRNFLVWKYIEGLSLDKWILAHRHSEELREVLQKIILQLHVLDRMGVAHNELSRPHGHIIITRNKEVYIIDFESSTLKKRAYNVTQFLGFLLNPRSSLSILISKSLKIDADSIRNSLKKYKESGDIDAILKALKLI